MPPWLKLLTTAVLVVASGCVPLPPEARIARRAPAAAANPAAHAAPLAPGDLQKLLDANRFDELERKLSGLQLQYEQGAISEEDLRDAFRAFYPTDAGLVPKYNSWIQQFPNSYAAHLARAIYYYNVAAERRGGAYIDRTTDEQIRGMTVALQQSSQEIQVSLERTRKPILSLSRAIEVAGLSGAEDHGRGFLDRAIALDATTFIPRASYMYNLQTRWGGSLEQMQSFLEESRQFPLSRHHQDLLESIVVEEQGWLHLHDDGDVALASKDYERARQLNPDLCLRCFKLDASEVLVRQRQYGAAVSMLTDVLAENPTDVKALDMRAQTYVQGDKPREAIADWTRAAEAGDAQAQNVIGGFYMNGVSGVLERNTQVGIEWFRKAAAQGDSDGMDNLKRALAFVASRPSVNHTDAAAIPSPH